jgi:signal transduction histidine kinase
MSENLRSGDTPSETRILAAVLEDRFEEIFEDYERRLYDINSLLVVGEGSARERYRSQASSLLERAARILRGEESSLVTVEEEVYRNIEAAREPLNPHPDEAFRAGIALCTAALAAVGENLPFNSSLREVVGVCLVIEEAAVDRLSRVVTASQVDYLLTKIRETQSEERRRFSRELHDRLAHSMATVRGSLELYETL